MTNEDNDIFCYGGDEKRATIPLMTGKAKTKTVSVRFDEKTAKTLEKEAEAKGLDLGTYLRMLIFTHPDREKK